ncbi:manganese efflux pump [Campylobacter sp. RM9344]|uniref:Putative manganese efflux pump MntP n=1 Tax=Campylobacter californiensis TaxID=1032243 RepID=A0AAW3ZQV7_9BACT|nr:MULTISPECIES: manganese efflux pump MntP family protein [unclassified Campylobacter]MBE2984543.1 manganese efflux pump [Campylobacter sp. RM6883]MBE2987198.1 manganese efflux pump [Campylobacter sp. RM12919]MBE2988891.1 manganese efflux pump [Campylobacter sp. RM12920]MBE2995169.1 manganese efflux pump [Campylobacter sp. RM6913]MBE3029090.1 manganese efflux pump [Campylobacter sp. RM9344]
MIFLLAIALAMDAVALSIINGAKNPQISISHILRISAVFGVFQALMPLIGFTLGLSFVSFIAGIDHFIAFGILLFLGIKMIKESREECDENLEKLSLKELLLGAIATSIDALAVGVTFSFEQTNILSACLIIGIFCFALCIIACYIGKFIGSYLHSKALVLGGAILIFLGCEILITHLLDHGFNF